MSSRAWPRRGLCLLILLIILGLAPAAWAVVVKGVVSGPGGLLIEGALISDGRQVVASSREGRFRLDSEPDRAVWVCPPKGFSPSGRDWWPVADAVAAGSLEITLVAHAQQPSYRVALLSDPHLMDAAAATVKYPPPPGGYDVPMDAWRRIADDLKQNPPDLSLVTGDLCMDGDQGKPAHIEAQMALARAALNMLPSPALAIPGNHDVRYDDHARPPAVDLGPWRRHLGPARRAWRLGPTVWIMWDNLGRGEGSNGKPRSLGATSAEALTWLGDLLAHLDPGTPLVLATHYPPASAISGANPLLNRQVVKADSESGLGLRDTDQNLSRVLPLLVNRRVLAWIHGHEHTHHETKFFMRQGNWLVLGLPAVCGRWWMGDRDWGPLAFPPGYVMLTLTPGPDGVRLESRPMPVLF